METKYLILMSGKMRTGKNTFAEMFKEECLVKGYSVKVDAYASVLKDWCSHEFGLLTDYLNNFTSEVMAYIPFFTDPRFDTVNDNINGVLNKIYTRHENWFENKNDITRLILQIVGTNIFRKYVDDDFWVKEFIKKEKNYDEKFVIVTDARFPNEIDLPHKLVENRRVISVRMERKAQKQETEHFSETALDNYLWFDYTVENNGDFKLLRQSVQTTLNDIENTLIL
jgi:hypothetical protein